MDETTTVLLAAIKEVTEKIDILRETVSKYTADTGASFATLNEWKRTQDGLDLGNRVRSLEQDRVTQSKLDTLKEDIQKIKTESAANRSRDKVIFFIVNASGSVIFALILRYFLK